VISPGVVYNTGLLDLAAAYKEIELVGPLPREPAAWIDTSTAVSARSANPRASLSFIRYITRPEASAIWKAKGLERF